MDELSFIRNTVNAIVAMDSKTRIAIVHNLLMKLEDKRDITRWQFWDRYSVKEHGEDLAERTLTDIEVDDIMENLNTEWNKPSFSVRDTEAFTEAVNKYL